MGTPLLEALVHAIDTRTELPIEVLEPWTPEQRLVIRIVLAAIEPRSLPEVAAPVNDVGSGRWVATSLLDRWVDGLVDAGRVSAVATWITQYRFPASVARRGAARLLAQGALDDAMTLVGAISWTDKAARALALVDVWRASGADARLTEALAAIVDTGSITIGTGRGIDEIHALSILLQALRDLGPAHPMVVRVLEHIARYARAGQRQSEPKAFAVSLAEIAESIADDADAAQPGWLAAAESLRADLVLPGDGRRVEEAITRAKARIERGENRNVEVLRPADVAASTDWRASRHFAIRSHGATEEIALALDHDDRSKALSLLIETLEPSVATYPGALAAFGAATGPARDAFVLDLLRFDPTAAINWCTKLPQEVWEWIPVIDDVATLRAAIELMFERDFVTCAYPAPTYNTPGSVSALVARASIRLEDEAMAARLLAALVVSQRKRAAFRLFDAIAVLGEKGAFDLAAWQSRIPEDQRWVLWGVVAGNRMSIAEGTERFGPLDKDRIYAVARALALAGRVGDAIAIAEHEHANTTEEGRPPPMQDGLLEIVRSGVPLDGKQQKTIVAKMKKAPRLRDRGSQTRYGRVVAELDRLLAERDAAASAGEPGRS